MNFLDLCWERDKVPQADQFKATFCCHCRNAKCDLAGWASDNFTRRVLTQEERLFRPQLVNPLHYREIPDFIDKSNAPQPIKGWSGNTPEPPPEGVMADGSAPPKADPWAAPIVKPGTKIEL